MIISADRILNKAFAILIVYYWILIYLQKQEGIANTTLMYLILVIPISGFVFFASFLIKRTCISKELFWIILFIVVSVILSFFRLDYNSMASAFLFGTAIIVIGYFRLKIDLRLINTLFLISILVSIPLYYSGYTIYGFLPGQSNTNNLEILAGRVSLFPNVSTSIYFSLLVFTLNLFFNRKRNKFLFLIFSLYYIYFGISRTGMLVLFLVVFFYYISNRYPVRNGLLYSIFFPAVLILFPLAIVFLIVPVLNFLLYLSNEFISNYMFRGYTDVRSIMDDSKRLYVWSEHIRVFADTLWGLSPSLFSEYLDTNLIGKGGSESFITRILLQYGIAAFFIYLFLVATLRKAIMNKNSYNYLFVFIFLYVGLLYGSFFNVYNVLFLILISSPNMNRVSD